MELFLSYFTPVFAVGMAIIALFAVAILVGLIGRITQYLINKLNWG